MSLPSSNMRATDYNLGIVPPSPGRSVVKVGACSAGDTNVLTFPATKTDLVGTYTSGPAVEAAALALDYPGHGQVGVCRTAASVAGTAGSVTKTDPAGAVGTPTTIGANNARITLVSKQQGVSIVVVVAGTSTGLTVPDPVGGVITVNSATDNGGTATSTASDILAAILAKATAMALLSSAALTSGSNGSGVVGAIASTALPFGSTAALSVSGAPLDAWQVRVKATRAGGTNTGAFRYSLDGGDVYSDELVYPGGSSYAVPGSGLTLTFSGSLAVGDVFSFDCVAPTWSNSDLAAALDAVIASTASYSIVHVVGPQDATTFATVSTKAASAESVKKFLFFVIEAAGQSANQTNAQWSAAIISTFASSADKRIGLCAMEAEIASVLNQPQAGRTMRRPVAWALAARAGSIPISEDIGRVASGPLLGVSKVYQLDQGETLDAAGFACAFTLPDYEGFYGSGRLKSPSGSDFQLWQDIRLINEVMRVGYKGQTRYLNDSLRVRTEASGQYPAGSIDPGDAQTVEAYLAGLLRDAITGPGYATEVRPIVDRTVNMVSQKLLRVKYEATPLGTIRTIDGAAGLKNPALALG